MFVCYVLSSSSPAGLTTEPTCGRYFLAPLKILKRTGIITTKTGQRRAEKKESRRAKEEQRRRRKKRRRREENNISKHFLLLFVSFVVYRQKYSHDDEDEDEDEDDDDDEDAEEEDKKAPLAHKSSYVTFRLTYCCSNMYTVQAYYDSKSK